MLRKEDEEAKERVRRLANLEERARAPQRLNIITMQQRNKGHCLLLLLYLVLTRLQLMHSGVDVEWSGVCVVG